LIALSKQHIALFIAVEKWGWLGIVELGVEKMFTTGWTVTHSAFSFDGSHDFWSAND